MIKLKLKRRLSGRAIKQAKRKEDNELYRQSRRFGSALRNRNKNVGRKYPVALYELKFINVYQAERLAKKFKAEGKLGKLKRLYKIQPNIDPKNIARKEHEERVKKWQAKLKANQLCQSSK